MAQRFRQMDAEIGQPIYWEVDLGGMGGFFHPGNFNIPGPRKDLLIQAEKIFAGGVPAFGAFLGDDATRDQAKIAIAAGREWCHPIFFQYENYGYFQYSTWGTNGLRDGWEEARNIPSTLMQYITWNDYHETTNLSPGIDSRYSYYDLTGYYIQWWKTGVPPVYDHDKVYIFSHKYPHGAKVFPFQPKADPDNCIEVVSILTKPARLRARGRKLISEDPAVDGAKAEWDAPAGYSFQQLKLTPGPVVVDLLRDGKVEIHLHHPEPVSDKPFREDIGKTCWSTEEGRNWKADFGGRPMEVYSEYGDVNHNGLPNWFEMLWFGKWGDMSTAGACPDANAIAPSGKTLLECYREQKDPTKKSP